MVLRLKTRESRSLPGLQNATKTSNLLVTSFGPADTKGRSQSGLLSFKQLLSGKSCPHVQNAPTIGRPANRKMPQAKLRSIMRGGAAPAGSRSLKSSRTKKQETGKSRCSIRDKFLRTCATNAGWSSPVARQAHNLKAAGSNPAPATKLTCNAFQSASASARTTKPLVGLFAFLAFN